MKGSVKRWNISQSKFSYLYIFFDTDNNEYSNLSEKFNGKYRMC